MYEPVNDVMAAERPTANALCSSPADLQIDGKSISKQNLLKQNA